MWDVAGLQERLKADFMVDLAINDWLAEDKTLHEEKIRDRIAKAVNDVYALKEQMVGESVLRHFEKAIMLQSLDQHWKEHLAAMDQLRQGIHLRGYAQKNPKQEYKREAFELFTQMLDSLKADVVNILSKVQVRAEEEVTAVEEEQRRRAEAQPKHFQHDEAEQLASDAPAPVQIRNQAKVNRNDPCPCGSGKKYKQCHGQLS